jgi:uncharacterized protein YqhQ
MASTIQIGGQAVIEGVMMRGKRSMVVAVRTPKGTIVTQTSALSSWGDRWPVFKLPLFRGLAALADSLTIGISTLVYSANQASEEDEQLTAREMSLTVVGAVCIATLLFIVTPVLLTRFLRTLVPNNILLNVIEFSIRMAFFVGYVALISRLEDVQRIFAYHGAEHKTVHAYEAGLDLTVDNIRPMPTEHPRCGTSFIIIVFMVSMLFFVWIGYQNFLLRVLSRIVLLPIIAGVSYEIIRLAGKSKSPVLRAFCAPGMLLQRLTTKEPDDKQIQVAVSALEGVLKMEAPQTSV